MLVFEQKQSLKEGVWREYAPGVEVKIRACSRSKFRQLAAQARQTVKRRRGQTPTDSIDHDKLDRLLYRHLVADWKGIVDPQKKAIPCTDEMVELICDELPDLADWIADEAAQLADEQAKIVEEELGNSGTSHGGKLADQKD